MVSLVAGALMLLQHMTFLGISPDVISFNAAITACGRQMQWQVAMEPWPRFEGLASMTQLYLDTYPGFLCKENATRDSFLLEPHKLLYMSDMYRYVRWTALNLPTLLVSLLVKLYKCGHGASNVLLLQGNLPCEHAMTQTCGLRVCCSRCA